MDFRRFFGGTGQPGPDQRWISRLASRSDDQNSTFSGPRLDVSGLPVGCSPSNEGCSVGGGKYCCHQQVSRPAQKKWRRIAPSPRETAREATFSLFVKSIAYGGERVWNSESAVQRTSTPPHVSSAAGVGDFFPFFSVAIDTVIAYLASLHDAYIERARSHCRASLSQRLRVTKDFEHDHWASRCSPSTPCPCSFGRPS